MLHVVLKGRKIAHPKIYSLPNPEHTRVCYMTKVIIRCLQSIFREGGSGGCSMQSHILLSVKDIRHIKLQEKPQLSVTA